MHANKGQDHGLHSLDYVYSLCCKSMFAMKSAIKGGRVLRYLEAERAESMDRGNGAQK
jgi:hypothetical protein